MPFWSDATWLALPDDILPVHPFDKERLEEAKYIMSIGEEVYISSNETGNTIRTLKENQPFQLGPGQFAYIITHEIVRIPLNAIGFISINAKVKFGGLVNISGFHVDPGYHGRLIFSVFNAGPSPIHLRRGQPIFPLWIASLDAPTRKTSFRRGYDKIDPNLITAVSSNYTTAFEVAGTVQALRDEFDAARVDISSLKATRNHVLIVIATLTFILGGVVTSGLKLIADFLHYGHPWYESTPTSSKAPTLQPSATLPALQPVVQPTPTPPVRTDRPHG